MNAVIDLLEDRMTLRKFAPRDIEQEKEEAIIQAALRAPSGSNMMRYSIIKVSDPELRMAIQKNCKDQPYISKAPLMLIFCADDQRYIDYYEAGKVPEKCREIGVEFHYPSESSFLMSAIDATLAAHNAVLAAESMGLGSCYLGHILSHIEDNRRLLCLPPYVFPVLAVIFGYQAEGFRRTKSPRYAKKYILHEDRYCRLGPDELETMFGERFKCPEGNRYSAENPAQFSYIQKFGYEPAYQEMARSVREILRDWQGEGPQADGTDRIRKEDKDG